MLIWSKIYSLYMYNLYYFTQIKHDSTVAKESSKFFSVLSRGATRGDYMLRTIMFHTLEDKNMSSKDISVVSVCSYY